jgi:FHA domain-containing protein
MSTPALSLQVVSLDASPVAQPMTRAFESDGGTIGRDDTNMLALPDKHRRVSRLHATISFPGGMPTITNSSSSLPISVGEQQLDSGDSMPIGHGTLIEIGPYILRAHVAGAVTPTPVPVPKPMPYVAASEPTVRMERGAGLSLFDPSINLDPHPTDYRPAAPAPAPMPSRGSYLLQQGGGAGIASTPAVAPSDPFAGLGADFWSGQAPAAMPTTPPAVPYEAPRSPQPLMTPLTPDVRPPVMSAPAAATNADPFADLLNGIGGPSAQIPVLPSAAAPFASPGYIPQPSPGVGALSADPLAAFGGVSPVSSPPGGQLTGSYASDFGVTSRPPTPGGLIPDDFNPFDLPSSSSRNAADPLAALVGGNSAGTQSSAAVAGATPSIDTLFQSAGSGASDGALFGAAPAVQGVDGTLEGLIRSNSASDPLTLFDSASLTPAPVARPMRDNSLEIGSAFSPPKSVVDDWSRPAAQHAAAASMVAALPANALAAPAQRPAANPSPPAASASPDALTDAFLRGAGLAPTALPHGLTPEIMTIVGSLLRSATAGAVDMLAARAATKREVQASVTIISVQANNPLKFLPNADAALLQLLGKKMPGFMRADVAMRDAFDDLRAHEVGVIAGTRAALTEVLGKFDPAVLGDKLAKGSVLESLMPSARKAKLWDMYLERYLQIRREAEDDFQSIFGRAFVQAYERETARIKGESPVAGGERG